MPATQPTHKVHPRLPLLERLRALPVLAALGLLLGAAGCTQDEGFISDNPWANDDGWSSYGGDYGGGYGEDGAATNGGDDGGTGGDGGDGDESDDGAGQAVLEADIIQLEDDTLYALSEWSGLSVIDAADPAQLDMLGQYETDGAAFEMYVDAGQVFVMLNEATLWEWDDDTSSWSAESSSSLLALDASDPDNIELRGEFILPGHIQDSRRVGDILYLVSLEDGYCYGCADEPRTVVTSIDIADPANPAIVDQLDFVAADDSWDWRRSVAATAERLYVASRHSWNAEGVNSEIDVVDISDPSGALVPGAKVYVAGTIDSRWQMDEYEGVLRTVSQSHDWWNVPPVIETFAITDSNTITPLGSLDMVLPMPESLRSVRFDGPRAFAITAVETDPLFTIDLSEPSHPMQIGELEIPGWVYHMEIRGDRILALGFDNAHPEGALNVSLFDVTNFSNPILRRRVHFGGDWGDFAEDQNQIHKAFTILEEQDLLLVPFAGWEYGWGEDECAENGYRSGVQLIDWANDDLTLRGVAPAHGRTRRSFTHKGHLFAVSDAEVATFDVQDRDAPVRVDDLATGVWANQFVSMGAHMIRYARDWYTDGGILEIIPAAEPGHADPIGRIHLSEYLDACDHQRVQKILAQEDAVYVVVSDIDWGAPGNYGYDRYTRVLSFDLSDPSAPSLAGSVSFPDQLNYGGHVVGGFSFPEKHAVLAGDHLVFSVGQNWWEETPSPATEVVVDVSDVSNPRVVGTLDRSGAYRHGGLQVSEGVVTSWRAAEVSGQPDKVRFYLETLDLDGAAPSWEVGANVPGLVAAYDADSREAWTVEFRRSTLKPPSDGSCWDLPGVLQRIRADGRCVILHRDLLRVHTDGTTGVVRSETPLDDDGIAENLHVTKTRALATYRHIDSGTAPDYSSNVWTDLKIIAREDKATRVATLHGSDHDVSRFTFLGADDHRILASGRGPYDVEGRAVLIDTADPTNPVVTRTSTIIGWGECASPLFQDEQVVCPMGIEGVTSWTF